MLVDVLSVLIQLLSVLPALKDLSLTPLVDVVKQPMNVHSEDTETLSVSVKLFAPLVNISLLLHVMKVNAPLDTKPKKPTKHVLKIQFLLDAQNPNSYKVESVWMSALPASGPTPQTESAKAAQLDVIVV